MQVMINDALGRRLREAAVEAKMSVEAFIEKTMTKILDKSKVESSSDDLKEFLLSMPITEGDEFDKEVLKELEAERPTEPAGTLDDLMKELKICR